MMKSILSLLAASVIAVPSARSTIVAWDGNTLACDSQMTCGHLRKTCPTKIHRINGHLVGCAGSAAQNRAFIEWFGNQSKPFPEFGDSHALVIRPDGTAWFYEGSNSPLQICGKAAIGSGGDFALAAMATGANAIEAVKIAEQLDIYCGGEIKSLKLDAPKK